MIVSVSIRKWVFIRISQPGLSWWFYSAWLKYRDDDWTITIDGDSVTVYFTARKLAWKYDRVGLIMSMRYHFKSTIFEDEDSAFSANHQDATMLRLRQEDGKWLYIFTQNVRLVKGVKMVRVKWCGIQQKDIRETPPTAKELWRLKKLKLKWKKMANTSGIPLAWLKDKLPEMMIKKFQNFLPNGMLIKHPLVLDNGEATFGFKEEVYEEKWKNKMKK